MAMFWVILVIGSVLPHYAYSDCSIEEFGAFKRDIFEKLTSLAQSVLEFTKSNEAEKKAIQSALNTLLLKRKDMQHDAQPMHDEHSIGLAEDLDSVERMVPGVASLNSESVVPDVIPPVDARMINVFPPHVDRVAPKIAPPEVELKVTDDVKKTIDVVKNSAAVNDNAGDVKKNIDVVKNSSAVNDNAGDVKKNIDVVKNSAGFNDNANLKWNVADVGLHLQDDLAKKAIVTIDKAKAPLEKQNSMECKTAGMICSPQNMMFCCEALDCKRALMRTFGKCR